jgi:hypothetical protein
MAPTQLSAKEKANRANHARRVFKAYNEQKIKSSLKARKEISKTDQKELFERFAIIMADELYRNGLDVVINDLSLYGTVIDVQDSPLPAEGKGKAPAVPNMPVAWKLAGHLIGMKSTSGPITRQDLLYFGQGETVAHVEDLLDDSLSATDSADSDDGNGDGSSGAGSSGAGSSSAGSSGAGSSSAGSSGAGGPSGADNLPPRPPSRKQGGPPSKRQRRASPVTQPGSTKYSTVGAQLYRGSDFGLDLNAIKAKVREHLVEAITSKRVLPPLASAQLARFPVAVKDIQHSNRRQKLNGPGFDATPMRNLDTRYAMKTLADVIEYSTRVRDPRGTMKPDFAIHGMVTRNRDPGVTKQNRVTHGRVTKGNAPTQNYLSLGTHMMDMTKANRNRFDAEYPPNAVGKTKIPKASKRQQIAEKVTREVLWQALEDVATQKPGLKIPSNRETANRYSILEDGLGKTSKKGITNREIGNAPWDTLGTVGMQEARLDRLQLTAEDAAASVVTNFIDELLDYLPLKYVRDESVEHIYSIIFGAIQNAIEPFEKPDPLALKKKLAADLIAKVLADKFGNSRAAAEEILAYFQASEGPEEYQPEFAQVYPTCGYQLTSQPVELGGPKSTKPMKTGRRKTPEPAQVRATSEVEQRFPVQEYDHIEESIRKATANCRT